MTSDFEAQFTETLRTAGQALAEEGYDVENYHVFTRSESGGLEHVNHRDTPEEALNATLEEIYDENLTIRMSGEDLADIARGNADPTQALYQTLNAGIETSEPTVTKEEWTGEALAFGTIIHYTPEFPDDYFEIGTAETMPPYTREDAEERVNDIIGILEDAGLKTERGHIE